MDKNELYHYGVLGMKWGVRKEYKPVGRRRPKQETSTESKKGLTDKQKRAIKIGAAAAVTLLAAYGGYKLYKSGVRLNNFVDPANGLKLQKNTASLAHNIKAVNPKFGTSYTNYYDNNCGNCAIAFEARMRGYDVTAKGSYSGMSKSQIGQFFKGLSEKSFAETSIDISKLSQDSGTRGNQVKEAIEKTITNQYKDSKTARGMLFFPADFGNHWVSWVKDNDKVTFIDSQIGTKAKKYNYDLVRDVFSRYTYHKNSGSRSLTSIRLDDLEFDSSNIRNVIDNVHNKIDKTKYPVEDFDSFVEKGMDFVMKR